MNDNIRPAATHCRDAAMRRATSAQRATRSSVVAIGGPDSRGTPDEVELGDNNAIKPDAVLIVPAPPSRSRPGSAPIRCAERTPLSR